MQIITGDRRSYWKGALRPCASIRHVSLCPGVCLASGLMFLMLVLDIKTNPGPVGEFIR